MGRNKAPSENTIRMLCSKAAGMCEFEGCNKRLFYDNVTHAEFNNAYVAHIVASSANGPRGNKILSPQLSDKLDNLMLMCADHHKLIDLPTTGPRDYPVERLKAMKKAHEEKIEKICKLFYVPKTEIVMFASPIKGLTDVNIDYNMAVRAILPHKQPDSTYGINIIVSSVYDYRSQEYWRDCVNQIDVNFKASLYGPYIQFNKANFSIFPLAPIPLIIKFGEVIGDKMPCDVFQKTRVPDSWEWQANSQTNNFTIESVETDKESNNIALVISIINDINIDRLPSIDYKTILSIKSENRGVDAIKSVDDLSAFWHLFQEMCDNISNTYGKDCIIHLFPAIPVSVAFEIGRRYMKCTYPTIKIYDECDGFFETITLGG